MTSPGLVELDGNYILGSILAFLWLVYVWETFVELRQLKVFKTAKSVPDQIKHVYSEETFQKARSYQQDKMKFSLIHSFYSQLETMVILILGGIPFLWNFSAKCLQQYGYDSSYEITCTIIFALIGACFSTVISLPWSLYSTFVIEDRHGFNKQTLGFFIKDQIKKFIVMQAIGLPIMAGLIYIIKAGGDYFYVYCWAFVLAVSLIMITVYPDYIAPLFDKFTPLPDGPLRQKIEDLAATIKFPLTKLYVVDGSKRSAHSNAYFYGFFKNKRIVLFDTLLEDYKPDPEPGNTESQDEDKGEGQKDEEDKKDDGVKKGCTDEEVLAVLSHELGHWYLNHVLKNFFIGQLNTFLCFAGFAYLMNNSLLYAAFGFNDSQPTMIGLLIIFSYVFAPYNEVMNFSMTVLSRRFEFQADAFSKRLGNAEMLKSALVKLSKDNLGFPITDWLYSAWTYSHPPLLERLNALHSKSD